MFSIDPWGFQLSFDFCTHLITDVSFPVLGKSFNYLLISGHSSSFRLFISSSLRCFNYLLISGKVLDWEIEVYLLSREFQLSFDFWYADYLAAEVARELFQLSFDFWGLRLKFF